MDTEALVKSTEREIALIEAELLAGNPDVAGLCVALSDWCAELRILEDEKRRQVSRGHHRAPDGPNQRFSAEYCARRCRDAHGYK
jgi:hypothetical protein